MKTAKEHYHAATHTLKITLKVLHKGTHAYKESVLKWKSITDLTKKDHAEKEMELKKEWMSKVEIRHTKAAETLEGFKVSLAAWKLKWLAAKARMNKMKKKSGKAVI